MECHGEKRGEESEAPSLLDLPYLRDERIYEELLRCSENMLAKELAEKLNVHLKGFESFITAPLDEIMQIEGVDEDTAVFIGSLAELCRRAIEQRERNRIIDCPFAAAQYAASKLMAYDREAALLMCLSDDLHCEYCRVISDGGAFSTDINVYTMVCVLLSCHSHIAILAHNHLTEGPEPSEMDELTTYNILHNLKNVGIMLLDHIIISGGCYTSMAANGAFRGETEEIRRVYCPLEDSNDAGEED